MPATEVAFAQIRNDASVSPRHRLDLERMAEFAALYETDGIEALPLPELVAVGDGTYLIADGWHRLGALGHVGVSVVPVTVVALEPGEDPFAAAYRRALVTSAVSSKPLTRAEKHDAIRRLAADDPDASDRAIARLVGVDHKTVGRVLREDDLEVETPQSRPRELTPDAAAKRLFRGFEKAYEARGLGIGDYFRGDRTGVRLATILSQVYDERALERATQFRGWLDAAVTALVDQDNQEVV